MRSGAPTGTRCNSIIPSNGLADYVLPTDVFEDIDIIDGTIDVDTGTITNGTGGFSVLIPAPPEGRPIRLLIGDDVYLRDVTVVTSSSDDLPALAILARGTIVVDGVLRLEPGQFGAPGSATSSAGAVGAAFGVVGEGGVTIIIAYGSGGGGHVYPGGRGGDIPFFAHATPPPPGRAQGGSSFENETLVPLRGGGGSFPVSGGGAVQLASDTSITINGTIDARGEPGRRQPLVDQQYVVSGVLPTGGGAGGGILLEAPHVMLGSESQLLATGSSGASLEADGEYSNRNNDASGASCTNNDVCGYGGHGSNQSLAGEGGDALYSGGPLTQNIASGGGGGAPGVIRINTLLGTVTAASGSLRAGVSSTGTVSTQ